MDQGKKTMRHFYCRDVLWDIFEQMANDFDCSIDYLINEAMRYYARSKNYAPAPAPAQQRQAAPPAQQPAQQQQQMPARRPPPPPAQQQAYAPPPAVGAQPAARPPAHQPPAQRPPARPPQQQPPQQQQPYGGQPMQSQAPPAQGMHPGSMPPPMGAPQPQGMPPGQAPSAPAPAAAAAGGPTLFLIFNNQRIPIDKDQFIIGRGSKTSDLAIKDGNISRKHSAVIRRNGTFYIKDLGSTNGIDYKGMRIDNKRIDEGDVFHLCDYELRFTYRG